jgi:predicted AAA+ superfamily ATPase
MYRSLIAHVLPDLDEKIVLISGPRQCGKTTLAKTIRPDAVYLNYDDEEHRYRIHERSWNPEAPLIIFDELHKMKEWKRWLKGLFDTRGIPPRMLVTGSAKLDTYRKVGDSLAGRYFSYRLHPFDLKELAQKGYSPETTIDQILTVSGFPEPFLKQSESYYKRWVKTHHDIILRQDLIDLERVADVIAMERLIDLLSRRVGSPVSYSNLAQDLQRDPKTIKKWVMLLEELYIIFAVHPYSRSISRAHLKMPKYYFYNTASVKGDLGAKFENLVACALLKEVEWNQDVYGSALKLCFIKNKEGLEVDFCITEADMPYQLIECKWKDTSISKGVKYFSSLLSDVPMIQLVKESLNEPLYFPDKNITLQPAAKWLSEFSLTPVSQSSKNSTPTAE